MKMKKLMSAVLAGVMTLSLGVTAFASGTSTISDLSEGASMELTSVTQGATIKVIAPTSAMIGLNPYEMNVKLEDGALKDNGSTKGKKVISPVYEIKNMSTLAVDVEISATGSVNGDGMKFVDAAPADDAADATAKWVKLDMKYATAVATTGDAAPTAPGATASVLTLAATAKKAGTGEGADAIITMQSANATSNKNALVFTFDGDLNKNANVAWTNEDTVGAEIAFTFAVNTTVK